MVIGALHCVMIRRGYEGVARRQVEADLIPSCMCVVDSPRASLPGPRRCLIKNPIVAREDTE